MNRQQRDNLIAQSDAPAGDLAEQFGVSTSTVYRIRRESRLSDNGAEPFASSDRSLPRMNRRLLFDQLSTSGITRYGGNIEEEFQRELRGDGGIKLYTQMSVHATVAAVLFAIQMAQRQVSWFVEPYSDDAQDVEAAEFLEGCMDDMVHTWEDNIAQVFSMLKFGFSVCEMVYKKRLGQSVSQNAPRSRFDDGRIGWRRWQHISPKSLDMADRWIYDDQDRLQGFRQLAPPNYQPVAIPLEKALLFRTTVEFDNPEGLSILRPMYQSWYYAENLSEVEAIAAERMGTGIPAMYLGTNLDTSDNANSDWAMAKDIVRNVRTDEQMGLVFPYPKMGLAPEGTGVLFELISPPSQGLIDFSELIDRHEKRMAMTVLAQFIFLGMLQVGTQALNQSSTDTFQMSIGAWSDSVAAVINRYAVPRLFALNAWNVEELPRIRHSDIGVPDLPALAEFINKLVGSQVLTPDGSLEQHLREAANLPEQEEAEIEIVEEPEPEPEIEEEDIEEEPVEIEEEASEWFAAKTIKGALARDEQTGEFTRGGGQPLSDEEVKDADAMAFGKMTAGQAGDFRKMGLMAGKKLTPAGKQMSRLLRTNPHKGVDKMAALRSKHGIMVKLSKKGGKGKKITAKAAKKLLRAGGMRGEVAEGFDKLMKSDDPAALVADDLSVEVRDDLRNRGLITESEGGKWQPTQEARNMLSQMQAGNTEQVHKMMRKQTGTPEPPPEDEEEEESADFFHPDLIDEGFALRLKTGGPKWERSTNAYELELRRTYQAWADDTATALAKTEDQDDFDDELAAAVALLIGRLRQLGRRRLPEAYTLGLGNVPASPAGIGELSSAIASNDDYLTTSLGPDIQRKASARVQDDPLIRGDVTAMGAVLLTYLARVGSYSGAYWTTIQRGFGDAARQQEEQSGEKVPVQWRLDAQAKHCDTCLRYGNREYDSWDDMLAMTGGAMPSYQTICNGNCRCSCYAFINGQWVRIWTHLAQRNPVAGLPLTAR